MRLRLAIFRRSVIALLAAILIAASAASAAAEQQLSTDQSYLISTVSDWVSWGRDVYQNGAIGTDWVLWRDGSSVPFAQPYERTLGTDAKGRAVSIESPCYQCRAVERRLSDGSVRPLPRRVVHVADESGGTLAYVRRDLGIYVLRRGARHVMRVSRANAAQVALGPRWLLYWDRGSDDTSTIAAIDLKRSTPRARTVATYSSAEEDCRCTDSFSREASPTIDGHVAYWAEVRVTGREGPAPPAVHTTLLRVDLAARHPVVEAFSPSQMVNDFAVARGTIYYTKTSPFDTSRGVYRVAAPKWEKTNRPFPVRG
jgi:hypothetical protein